MTLFLKIFLWFWLAIALIVGVFSFVSWTTQSEPIARQFRGLFADTFGVYSRVAAQIYEKEGTGGLESFLQTLRTSERITAVAFYNRSGEKIAGDELPSNAVNLFSQAAASEKVEFDRLPNETFAAKKISGERGEPYVMIIHLKRPAPIAVPDRNTWILRILAVILTAGLVCYWLASYLTSPVVKLRQATRRFASGELETRVGDKIGRRRDELSQLARDFDEMAERVESLVKSEKRLTQDISHELRSPLARLNVALELAKKKTNPENQTLLDRIEIESNRLNEMISRLLLLSKLESGGETVEMRRIDLAHLVEEIAGDADFEARAKGKAVVYRNGAQVHVAGSENLLRSAIENVLRNAVRYTRDETAVEVALAETADGARITVVDHGGGVPDGELENLFRPFYRIGEARERKSGGVGLGLAIAERAVEAHRGTIKASNTGDGLAVEIKIPKQGRKEQ